MSSRGVTESMASAAGVLCPPVSWSVTATGTTATCNRPVSMAGFSMVIARREKLHNGSMSMYTRGAPSRPHRPNVAAAAVFTAEPSTSAAPSRMSMAGTTPGMALVCASVRFSPPGPWAMPRITAAPCAGT